MPIGSCHGAPVHCRLEPVLVPGACSHLLFSIDWPFENIDHATDWFDSASISEDDRLKIGRLNAMRLLKLESSVREPKDARRLPEG